MRHSILAALFTIAVSSASVSAKTLDDATSCAQTPNIVIVFTDNKC